MSNILLKVFNIFQSTNIFRNEFNKAYAFFGYKDFSDAMRILMKGMIIEYHIENNIEKESLDNYLRGEIYGRHWKPRLQPTDFHAA